MPPPALITGTGHNEPFPWVMNMVPDRPGMFPAGTRKNPSSPMQGIRFSSRRNLWDVAPAKTQTSVKIIPGTAPARRAGRPRRAAGMRNGRRRIGDGSPFHRRELGRLRALAATLTTERVKARVLRQAQEHAHLIGLGDEHSGSE